MKSVSNISCVNSLPNSSPYFNFQVEKQWPQRFSLSTKPMHLRYSNGCKVRATLDTNKSIEIPHQWYNLVADLPIKPPPPLHPKTFEPIKPEDLLPLFPEELIRQEVTTDRFIDIPDEVRDVYSLWRPTPLIRAKRLEKLLDTPARIYYKYEGVSPAGSHKPNSAIPQAWYNLQEGVKNVVTETGAGQWGSALAFACSIFGLGCEVWQVRASYDSKPYRRLMMQTWGANVQPSFTYVSHSPHSQPLLTKPPLANPDDKGYLRNARTLDESLLHFNELDPSLKSSRICNHLLVGLLKSGRIDDARQVLDQLLQPDTGFPPDDFTGQIVFGELVKRDRPGKGFADEEIVGLVTKLCEYGVFPDTFKLTQLISKLCGNRKNGVAWELLHAVIKLGGTVEAASCNALLTGLGRERDIHKMNELLAEMEEMKIHPSVITFGILINQFFKSRRIDEALGVFDKLRGKGREKKWIGVEPDVVLYNTLINGLCKVGREEEGLNLLEEMKTVKKNKPNTITYNCLIDGFCKAGNIDKARELFGLMNEEQIQPNVVTLNTLVDGMCKIGRVFSAVEFFNEMKGKGLKGNAVTYTALISAFCGVNNIDKAMQYFDEMLSSGCSPDAIVYYCLISGLTIAGRMDDASVVVSQLKRAGFGLDRHCYNVLISGFCKKKKLERVYEMLNEMEENGVKPDIVTYNTLVSYLGKAGDFATATKVMKKMIKEGLKPSVVTYGAVIHAYCLKKNIDEAMKIFGEMCSTSMVPPNTVIYNILIDALCKNNDVERAVSLMDDMKVKGVQPNTTTYNAIFKGVQDKRMLHKAFELMDRMVEDACNPDYVTMEILTEWLSAIGEIEKLKLFVKGHRVSSNPSSLQTSITQ